MIEINLLPDDVKKSARAGDRGTRLTILVSLLLVTTAIGVGYFRMVPLRARLATHKRLSSRLAELEKQSAELATLQAAIKHIEKRKRALTDLHEQRLLWSEKLDQLTDIVPPNVWLRSVRLSAARRTRGGASGGSLILECYSAGAEAKGITLFREELRGHTAFWKDVARMNPISHRLQPFPDYVEGVALDFTVDLTLKPPQKTASRSSGGRTRTARSR